jgi:hypothetical protein
MKFYKVVSEAIPSYMGKYTLSLTLVSGPW